MLSKKTRYAILALASLAREFGNGPVPISRIAGDEHIPQRFLEGILLELKNGGVLGSVRGKAGGYYLSRDPGEVTVVRRRDPLRGNGRNAGLRERPDPVAPASSARRRACAKYAPRLPTSIGK